ncbi:MAG: DUF3575 domain-containing protein [Bacteroidota bacterium]
MKFLKLFLLTISSFAWTMNLAFAQENVVRVAPFKLLQRTGALSYERVLNDQLSAGLSAHFRFPAQLGENFLTVINEQDSTARFSADQLSLSGFTLTPEIRYYPGGEAPKGFYVNPFARLMTYKSVLETSYTEGVGDITEIESKIRIITGGPGISIGYQWLITENLTIDWHGGFGLTFGVVRHTGTVTNGEISGTLQDAVDEVNLFIDENLPINWTLEIQDEASLRFTAPGVVWPVLRSSLSIGYAF